MNRSSLFFFSILSLALGAWLIGLTGGSGVDFSSENFGKTTEENSSEPLVFVFQKQKDPRELQEAAKKVGEFLGEKLGREVIVRVPSNYSASVQALVSNTADFAYTSSLPFLLARRDGGAKLLLAEERMDLKGNMRTDYDALLVTRADSPLKDISSLKGKASELRVAFTSPTSTSGYLFAHKRLLDEGILKLGETPKEVFKSARFAGSYTAALEEVLAGRADVAAVSYYTVEGPKAAKYLSPEKLKQLRVLARTPGVPTHLVVAAKKVSPELAEEAKKALLELSAVHPELLEDVYGTGSFKEVEEEPHVSKTVEAVKGLGLPVDDLNK